MRVPACLLYFDDEADAASRLAGAAGLTPAAIERHRFPDGELKLRLPCALPERVVLLRTLAQPNEKLVELLLAAHTARALGARHLTLVAPYLAYMRQDIAFVPGEAVSQRIVEHFLASLFDAVITVGPHLHRITTLDVAVTHALFAGDAMQVLQDAGVAEVWSTDCVTHPSNAVSVAPAIARALHDLAGDRAPAR